MASINFNKLIKKTLNDIRVELTEEYDRNFERKGFFSKKWKERMMDKKGSLMNVRGGGGLRGSIKSQVAGNAVKFTSNLPYASIHNEGGNITVTDKMKRFFWAKYYETSGKVRVKKDGKTSNSARNIRVSAEAAFYKNMALMKTGSKITIPQRQFMGDAPEVQKMITDIINENLKTLETELKTLFTKK